jgi:hypothetical protein
LLRVVFSVIPTQNATASDPNYGPVFVGAGSTICSNPVVITGNGFATRANPEPPLRTGNTGRADTVTIRSGGPGVVTSPRAPELLIPPRRE